MSITLSQLTDKQLSLIPKEQRQAMGPSAETVAEAIERAEIRSEKQLQTLLVDYLRQHGVEDVLRPRMDQKSTINKGWTDLTFVARGHAVCGISHRDFAGNPVPGMQHGDLGREIIYPCAWEVKMPGKEPTEEQRTMHKSLAKGGWQVAVIHSIQEAKAELQRLGVI